MSYQDDVLVAYEIVDGLYDRCSQIARKYNLSLQTNKKITRSLDDSDWTNILVLTGTEHEYRVGFKVSLSPGQSPGTVYIWSLVTDLATGDWHQFIRKDVPVAELRSTISEGLVSFEVWLAANDGIDPIEAHKKRTGTAHYWLYKREDGLDDYTTYFDGSDYIGSVTGDTDVGYEAELVDEDGTSFLELEGPECLPLMLQIEAKYKEMSQP